MMILNRDRFHLKEQCVIPLGLLQAQGTRIFVKPEVAWRAHSLLNKFLGWWNGHSIHNFINSYQYSK